MVKATNHQCFSERSGQSKPMDDRRGATERGYGARWQKYRVWFLRQHPLCCYCEQIGRLTAASVVDHIVPHRGDMELFWNMDNHQPLCKSCHDSVKRREEATGKRPGCDAGGNPVDPNHHWNKPQG